MTVRICIRDHRGYKPIDITTFSNRKMVATSDVKQQNQVSKVTMYAVLLERHMMQSRV